MLAGACSKCALPVVFNEAHRLTATRLADDLSK